MTCVASRMAPRFHSSGSHIMAGHRRRESVPYFHTARAMGRPRVTTKARIHSQIEPTRASSWAVRASAKLHHSANGTTNIEASTSAKAPSELSAAAALMAGLACVGARRELFTCRYYLE
jgi:hypothetical protein